MKLYKVKVNGKVYEVELESISEQPGNIVAAAPAAKVAPVVATEAPKTTSAGATIIAPMQGVIIGVNVKVGSTVKKGQAVVVLEAMKLENDIVTPVDGVVKQILVSKGQTVNINQTLVVIG